MYQYWFQTKFEDMYADVIGFDPSCVCVYFSSWADYEECGHIAVFELNGKIFSQQWQYSVMLSDNSLIWQPVEIDEDEALEIIIDWDSYVKQIH